MKDKEFSVSDFLIKHNLDYRKFDFGLTSDIFLKEMEAGLDGGSSLAMIPTFIEDSGEIPPGKPILVLDAGGTNLRAAMVSFSADGKAEIHGFRKKGMPGIERELSKKEFFTEIADFIMDLAEGTDRIGFCFSYPMDKQENRDGRLIKFSKEIKASEVEGELMGQGIINALAARGLDTVKKAVLLNDTVATLLAGKTAEKSGRFSAYIGLILGTGINASYSERNINIIKRPGLPAGGSQIINMEAGGYMRAPHGDIDEIFYGTTSDPSTFHYEKNVSGCYIGPLAFTVLNQAAAENAFSDGFGSVIKRIKGFSSQDLSFLLSDGILPGGMETSAEGNDLETARSLCRAVTDRAAFLAAAGISSIVLKTGRGGPGDKPVCICADGSTFWKLDGFREKIESLMTDYLSSKSICFDIIRIDNAPVIGAAVAGLTN